MLPPGFKVNGSTVGKISPIMRKIEKFLENLPKDELFTTQEIAARLNVQRTGDNFSNPALSEYRERIGGRVYWGSKAAIAKLRKELEEDDNDQDQGTGKEEQAAVREV